jgi:hypothetical protein
MTSKLRHPYRLHSASAAASKRRTWTRAAGTAPTIGEWLQAIHGEQATHTWLGKQLDCTPAVARQLAAFWMPSGTPAFVAQTLHTFANYLGVDTAQLEALTQSDARMTPAPARASVTTRRGADEPMPSAPVPRRSAAAQSAQSAPRRPALSEITLGGAEGVRVIRRSAPVVTWKKRPRLTEPQDLPLAEGAQRKN